MRTKDTFGVFMLQKLFVIKSDKLPGPVPIVITPTYVARGGLIGFAPGNNDVVPFTYNLPDGPVENIPVRTAQYYAVAVTLPFLKTPKMFGTFTVAPQWLVHTAGANVGNSMQLPQVLYSRVHAARTDDDLLRATERARLSADRSVSRTPHRVLLGRIAAADEVRLRSSRAQQRRPDESRAGRHHRRSSA